MTTPKGFKSKAQMTKLARLVEEGKFSEKKFQEMHKNTDKKILPDKVQAKPRGIIRGERRDRK